MKGLIVSHDNYTYTGEIKDNQPHGYGQFHYANGDIYLGQCKFGSLDGYGVYTYSKSHYTGFYSNNKRHGIGTYEDEVNIFKGSWRNGHKHGDFYQTKKSTYSTWVQKWHKGRLITNKSIQYIRPELLYTNLENPKTQKPKQKIYRGVEKKCIGCCEKPTNAVNDACGHVVMCFDCWSRCDACPICRSPIKNIIKLYIS